MKMKHFERLTHQKRGKYHEELQQTYVGHFG